MKEVTNQARAHEIMGRNYLGIEEAVRFGINISKYQLSALSEVPFSEAVLEECKDTHVLIAGFPMSILDIRTKVGRQLFSTRKDAWYNEEAFALDKGEMGWYLIRKDAVPCSTRKNWVEQQSLLKKTEEVPSARMMVYTIIMYYLITGERLFERAYAFTGSIGSYGSYIGVGYLDDVGLRIGHFTDNDASEMFGLASCVKPAGQQVLK